MAGPREYDCGRYSEGYGCNDKGVACGMSGDELVLRYNLVVAFGTNIICMVGWSVDAYYFHNLV